MDIEKALALKTAKELHQMNYMFTTTATVKPADEKKWYICDDIVNQVIIRDANDLEDAIRKYADIVNDKYGISVSANAIRTRQPMYNELRDGSSYQSGYVITGKTSFDNDRKGWVERYIDLWIDIKEYAIPEFPETK
jgi:hypothetical protein